MQNFGIFPTAIAVILALLNFSALARTPHPQQLAIHCAPHHYTKTIKLRDGVTNIKGECYILVGNTLQGDDSGTYEIQHMFPIPSHGELFSNNSKDLDLVPQSSNVTLRDGGHRVVFRYDLSTPASSQTVAYIAGDFELHKNHIAGKMTSCENSAAALDTIVCTIQ